MSPTGIENIVVHGHIANTDPALRDLYQQASIFIMPTRGDASPNVILEAMAAGLPVISTKVGGISDLVECGVTGLLAEAGSLASVTAALEQLLHDAELRAAMGEAGFHRARTHFDVRKNAAKVLDLAMSLAGTRL